jgi:microcompartment protein CcmK/EutM
MKTLISILSGKGGVGKSQISVSIAQSLKQEYSIKCFDNDSQVPTLSKYKSLNAKHLMIYDIDQDGEILPETLDITKLDEIALEIENGNNEIVLVDNGSSSFNPFLSAFSVEAIEMLYQEISNFNFIVVIPVTADITTHKSAFEILTRYSILARYIIVENFHFGTFNFFNTPIGKLFESNRSVIINVKLQRYTDSFLKMHEKMRDLNLTKEEALDSKTFQLIEKSRIRKMKKDFDDVFLTIIDNLICDSEK